MSGKLSRERANQGVRASHKIRGRYVVTYRSNSSIDRLDARHPGVRALVEDLLRRRVRQGEIARRVRNRFRVKISANAIARYFMARVRPEELAAASEYRQAHAQARALIEEMKADPSLDAAKIAEIMLANQIVRDRTKLAEADIMDLYKEQRERKKLELQRKALRLREKQTIAVLDKTKKPQKPPASRDEVIREIREIYGLNDPVPPPAPEPAASEVSS